MTIKNMPDIVIKSVQNVGRKKKNFCKSKLIYLFIESDSVNV